MEAQPTEPEMDRKLSEYEIENKKIEEKGGYAGE